MKKSVVIVGAVAVLMLAWCIGPVQGQQEQGKVIFASAYHAGYQETVKGVSMAPIWGDATQGPHPTFTRFVPGYDAGMHTHTNDRRARQALGV